MFVEVDFGRPQEADAVVIESADEAHQTKVKLDCMDPHGKWTTLSEAPKETATRPKVSLRQAASAELKARGIRYVIVEKDDFRSEDYQAHTKLWGMRCLGEWSDGRLYFIE
jgi:hypothetical protein